VGMTINPKRNLFLDEYLPVNKPKRIRRKILVKTDPSWYVGRVKKGRGPNKRKIINDGRI
jgi:hypothetical protein